MSMRPAVVLAIAAAVLGAATVRPRVVFAPGARAVLAALDRPDRERFACMRGFRSGNAIVVTSAAAGIEAGVTRHGRFYLTEVSCPPGSVGLAHNHPADAAGDRRCWFRFPGTDVPTSDLVSFRHSKDAIAVIVCGARLVTEEKEEDF